MSKLSAKDSVVRLVEAVQTWGLPQQDAALVSKMLEAYLNRRIGAQRHQQKSVAKDVSVIHDFLAFCGKPPWRWTEEDFERWCRTLGIDRRVVMSTQRKYQSAIRAFLRYLTENVKFQDDVRRRYGVSLKQICHSDNCIPHVVERELSRETPTFTHKEVAQLFSAYDDAIAEAARFACKDFRPLQRDKAMFFLKYVGGLRASETLGLNVGSFQPNPDLPQLGQYGLMSAWGKGSHGSGPRQRTVPVTHLSLPAVLQWYIEKVRPCFLAHADPNEPALFLSERGRRLSLSAFEQRFQHGVTLAGLDGRGFKPHSLRHASSTHEQMRLSLEAVRRKLGHAYAATTQIYTHIPDEFVRDEIAKAVSSQLDSIREEGP